MDRELHAAPASARLGMLLLNTAGVEARDYRKIITIEPGKMGGKPCIRGMRMTVYDVLDYLASGMTEDEILHDFPDLTRDDIRSKGQVNMVNIVKVGGSCPG